MSAALMTEDDSDGGFTPTTADAPVGLSGSNDAPRGRATDNSVDDEFQIIETDDNFRPLTGPDAAPRQELRQEDSTDDAPARDRHTKAERRAAQRAARERQDAETRRYKEERDELRGKYDELAAKVQSIEPRLTEFDQSRFNEQLAGLNREIDASASTVENAITRMADAMASGDASAHAVALRDHTKAVMRGFELSQKMERLEASRQNGSQQPQDRQPVSQPRQQEQARIAPPQADPKLNAMVRDFNAKHPWIDLVKAADRDSKIALLIDREVYDDGFDPLDQDYYDEIESRLKEALPHRFNAQPGRAQARQAQSQVPAQRRGPMVAGGGGGAPASGPRTILLSPGRKVGLIQAGALDGEGRVLDREKLLRLTKSYDKYDREHGVGAVRQ